MSKSTMHTLQKQKGCFNPARVIPVAALQKKQQCAYMPLITTLDLQQGMLAI